MSAAVAPTVHTALAVARGTLEGAGISDPGREAQLLLAHVLERSRAYVMSHDEQRLPTVLAAVYCALVARRARREPYAYIVGRRPWLDLDLEVDRNVLIPRPETETLAEIALRLAADLASCLERAPTVLDVGTGSGALAIALIRGCPSARVVATDTCLGALATAARNAARLAPGAVRLSHVDLMLGLPEAPDLVVANLPYIPTADLAALEPELAFEPRLALDGGPDGLDAIRALLEQARVILSSHVVVLLECGHDQAERVSAIARGTWPDGRIIVHRDLANVPRFVEVRLLL